MQVYKLPFNCSRKEIITAAKVGFGDCKGCVYDTVSVCSGETPCIYCARYADDLYTASKEVFKSAKYRKKPVVVEAYKTDKEVIVHTLEGDMYARPGDYIITGIKGEKYPCKPDVFEQTYELVEE